jgi:hypothetical protein
MAAVTQIFQDRLRPELRFDYVFDTIGEWAAQTLYLDDRDHVAAELLRTVLRSAAAAHGAACIHLPHLAASLT